MKIKNNLLKRIVLGFFGLILAFMGAFTVPTLENAYADPPATSEGTSQTTTTAAEEAEQKQTCYDQVGAIGWIVCPSTGAIAKAIDAIYSIIQNLLAVKPISSDSKSPIHLVWEYGRNISNIVFVIFILVVIYSQLTGIGLSNYGIKKTLPRIIIAAILVNLSFVICQLAVDVSNIAGVSLRGFFTSIEESAIAGGALDGAIKVTWVDLVTAIAGGGTLAGIAITATGGIVAFIWMLIPAVLGAIISIVVGLITIAARQAVVALLIMISPLAFVAYLLPNTEVYFDKWRKMLIQMLVFYPMFSLLFGASELAGWAIISSADSAFGIILGMAVQVFPLIFSWSLMKMSGTVLGSLSNRLQGLTSGLQGSLRGWSNEHRNLARSEYTARQLHRPTSLGGIITASNARSRAIRNDRQRIAEENSAMLVNEQLMARKLGKRIIGYDKDGKPIYSQRPLESTREMRDEYQNREIKLRTAATKTELDNAMGAMGSYMGQNNIKDAQLSAWSKRQGQNYLEWQTQQVASRRNAISDKRYYFKSVQDAAERDKVTGELVNPEAYHRLIERGAGSDYYVPSNLTGQALAEAEKLKFDSATSVIADAYDMFEAERKITTAKYTTYLNKQVSKEVDKVYDEMLRSKNIDGIVAAQNVTAIRGDYDKIEKKLSEYLDQEGYLVLGSDFANTLALNLLSMKNASPSLGRLGKHINVETWRYTNGDRASNYVTMKEYYTGVDSNGEKTKFNAQVLLQGTGLKEIDRTFYDGLSSSMNQYFTAVNYGGSQEEADRARQLLFTNMLPQIIGAIGTFSSGSEQIINTMGFVAGAKYDSASDKWYIKPGQTAEETEEYKYRTRKYLSFLTAQNVIDMKTDTFNAIIARLAVEFGGDVDRAKAEFVQILTDRGILAQLQSTDPSFLNGMRPGVRRTLGL